jgi:hypothetical protein
MAERAVSLGGRRRILDLAGPGEAMNAKVTVTVNGKPTTLFLGLSVRHAIGAKTAKAVVSGRATVTNSDGNLVGLDGALYDGEALIVHGIGAVKRPRAPGDVSS